MSRLNPVEEANFIENQFREYLKDTFNFKDETYQKEFINELNKEPLYKGPYLNVNLPFVTTKSINELIDEGLVSPLFKELGNINFDQKLYKHQEESLNKICGGRNVVITTGTGSGKTESFLYPILNEILKEIEKGEDGPGIRAILLYPMNALVNDQIDRVRKILTNYQEIKYGFFTGETEEHETEDLREQVSKIAGVTIPPNEILSRDEIRERPPHLLFTNYSMLEYLLLRPNDFKIFTPKYLKNWKFIVLDEAHTYNGALGIEVSLLLRRLTGLCDKKPQFLLTSATLGQKNRDEEAIVSFAESLTSTKFAKEDIIFSTREKIDRENIQYSIEPNLYCKIDSKLNNIDEIKDIIKKYNNVDCENINELLYDFLIKDENLYDLYDVLANENIQFKEAFNLLSNKFKNPEELISLIHLINMAKKNGKCIYDIKYHTFIRTLSGAYITLGPKKLMSLSPCYYIDNLRTFELGNCRYCNALYIFGKEHENYLYQNNDIDIYENYEESEFIKVDYYLLSDGLDSENTDFSQCEENILCSNCGFVYNPANKNAKKCDCSEEYKVKVYKVKSSTNQNNIQECPCCHHHSNNGGIVRSVNLGKDEATAILAQILYKAIDDNEVEENNHTRKLSFSSSLPREVEKHNNYVKQFICFSDSRQQAGFFATFFESNHNRFLRKKLIWDVICKNDYQDIRFDALISKLEQIIETKKLFPDSLISSNKQAWVTALSELLNVDGSYGAEGLGLFYFSLDIEDLLNEIGEDGISEEFGEYHLDKKDISTLINIIFDPFRTTPAIDYTSSGLTPEEKKEYLGYRRFDNFVKLKKQKAGGVSVEDNTNKDGNVKSLLPLNNAKPNDIVKYIMKIAKCSQENASNIIETIFNTIGICGKFFEKRASISDDIFQISSSKYILKNYKTSKYYKCKKCGRLTPFNIHNVCPFKDCAGTLYECNPDEELKNNYYRKEYMNKKIERINVKEHTAQLQLEKAKEYQKEFKNKNINILSCSTTFEMGVDIGGLETVFMRNVPPTPANYVQRAGRAGRREDSSAFVLTFCGNSSHDYTYFEKPEEMISGVIKPPQFNITNEKIILRHLLAVSFGMFFRLHNNYFNNINELVCNGGVGEFKKYINSKPEDLGEFIDNKILDDKIYDKYCNFKWLDALSKNGNFLDNFENSIKDLLEQFEIAKNDAKERDELEEASYFKYQIEILKKKKVIEYLSRYNVIPKYGFPVDVVDLQVWTDGRKDGEYDLSRDLSIAISEYAPDSEIIVDKQKYVSQYITLPKTGQFTKFYYFTCDNCDRRNVDVVKDHLNKCCYCGLENEKEVEYFIEPIYGFKTGITKESTAKKPKKTYTGETAYLGDGKSDNNKITIGEDSYFSIETSSDDELLVMNESTFIMCPVCGYSKKYRCGSGLQTIPEEHLNYKGRKCSNESLHPIHLGHKFKTDVAKITVKNLEYKNTALSVLYALLEGISQEFNIERKDIDGIVVKNKVNCYDLIIYDNVPGGAGHVKRIMNINMLKETILLALNKVKQNCCDENSSCYNCLRNYRNQSYHKKLKRKLAREKLEEIYEKIK